MANNILMCIINVEVRKMKNRISLKVLVLTGLFMALVILMSSFGVRVPGGKMYLNDAIVSLAALILPPIPAFLAGGFGAFLGDFFFYPTPMFVSFAVHGLQAYLIAMIVKKNNTKLGTIIALVVGVLINIIGYSLGRAFIYANPSTAMLKLPWQILQASVGTFIAYLVITFLPLKHILTKLKK